MRATLDASSTAEDELHDAATLPPSSRRSFSVAALASIAGLHDTSGNVPLDRCVPVRTAREVPATITRDELYVLLYVDGESSLERISDETAMSLTDTVGVFMKLLSQGLVSVAGEEPARSQVAPRTG